MKRIFKIFLTISLSVLLCLSIMYYYFIGQYKVYCTNNNDFYGWFPYNEGDKLIFKNQSFNKTYTVISYEANLTKSYQTHLKCGYCEDKINIQLASNVDTITIYAQSFDKDKNAFGSYLKLNNNDIGLSYNQMDSIYKQKNIRIGNYLIEKEKGISEINLKKEIWKFKKIIKSSTKSKLTISSCN